MNEAVEILNRENGTEPATISGSSVERIANAYAKIKKGEYQPGGEMDKLMKDMNSGKTVSVKKMKQVFQKFINHG